MGRHLAERLLVSIPVLFGVLLLGFLLLQVVPNDPALVLAGPMAPPDVVAAIRKDLGLDEPIWYQFVLYLSRVLRGDLGRSIINNTKVIEELASAIVPTVELMLASLLWAIPLGISLGTLAAVKRGRLSDRAIMAFSVGGVSIPIFWLALVLIEYVGMKWQLLPFTGRGGPIWTVDGLRSLALPAIALGGIFVGPVARMTRTNVLEVLGADFVRTARAKGVRESRVVIRHALRNALIPVVTLVGLQCGYLLGGAVVTETIFGWPGVGRLAVGAILSTDYPLAQGAIIVMSVAFIVINLIVDLLYGWLDPRVSKA
jgi:ABC-type dipeptide/oligopeptide/nickel transport system permease component